MTRKNGSMLSGILSGGSPIDAALGKALDPSHHPFKRALYRPGGPGDRADAETHEWSCHKIADLPPSGKHKAGASRQRCTSIRGRKAKTVVIDKLKKRSYDKKWRAAFKKKTSKVGRDPRFRRDVRDPFAAYQPPKAKKSRAKKAK